MRLSRLAVSALLLAAIPLLAGDATRTGGLMNGRAWSRMIEDMQLGYLSGFVDHLSITEALINAVKEGKPVVQVTTEGWPRLTIGDIVKALNGFYNAPENLNLPIHSALRIIAKRVNGVPESEIQKLIEDARRVYPHADN